jgi:HEAT repeat protein
MRLVTVLIALSASATLAGAQQVPFDQVVERLKLPEVSARMSALRLLEESGYPEAGAPIAALLNDPDDRLQRAAVYAELGLFLGTRIETRRHVALVVEVRESQPAARAFARPWSSLPIAPVPMEVVTGMLGPIRHEDPAFRIEATYALGILGQIDGTAPAPGYSAVAEALADGLGAPAPGFRIAVARSAGRMFRRCAAPCELPGLDRLGDALVHTLNDPDREVRLAALGALGDLRWSRAVQALTAAYEYHQKGADALVNLVALARVGHPSSAPTFKAALSRKEDAFRLAGAEGLARIGGTDAAFAAQGLAAARSRELLVVESFAAVRSGDAKAVGRLVQSVDAGGTRLQACTYLIELGNAAASPAAAALGAAGTETRLALIETLSVIGGASDLAAVEFVQTDKDARVAAAAERAAMRIKARSKR